MSSLIISRIILTAFLAVSLSACSQGGGGNSKATKRAAGVGQPKSQSGKKLDLDEAKKDADAAKNGDKPADSATAENIKGADSEDSSDEKENSKEKSSTTSVPSKITVTPIASKKVDSAPEASKTTIKSEPAVTREVPKAAEQKKEEKKPTENKSDSSNKKVAEKSADKSAAQKSVEKKATDKKATDKKSDKVVSNKKSSTQKSSTQKSTTQKSTTQVAQKADDKATAEQKAKIDGEIVARDVARREIVVKNEADLDKDDSSKENLGASAYKTLVEKLLSNAKVDSSGNSTAIFANEQYFTATKNRITALPQSLFSEIHSNSVCSIESNRACLLVEVALDGKVTGSYIGFKVVPQAANPEMMESRYFKTFITDAAAQKDIETLSRISGGKTVLFVTSK